MVAGMAVIGAYQSRGDAIGYARGSFQALLAPAVSIPVALLEGMAQVQLDRLRHEGDRDLDLRGTS